MHWDEALRLASRLTSVCSGGRPPSELRQPVREAVELRCVAGECGRRRLRDCHRTRPLLLLLLWLLRVAARVPEKPVAVGRRRADLLSAQTRGRDQLGLPARL